MIGEGRFFRHGDGIARHDLSDLPAALVDEVRGRIAGAEKELKPAATPALRADLASPQKVALRQDADQSSSRIDHWQATDMVIHHQLRGIENGCLGSDSDDVSRHDLMCAHC